MSERKGSPVSVIAVWAIVVALVVAWVVAGRVFGWPT